MKKSIAPSGACRKPQTIKSKHYTRAMAHMLLAGLIAGAAVGPSNAFAQAEPEVLDKTIGEWSAKWWQWALAIPTPINPMVDDSGKHSHVGQEGPVWFLAGVWGGGTVTRSCTVPRGKHILFSIANTIWIQTPLDPPQYTEMKWRELASDFLLLTIGGKEPVATLNGKPIVFNPKTPIIRSQSPVFKASFPTKNLFGQDPSLFTGYPIVSDGFWVMLPPLSPGLHILHFQAGDAQASENKGQDVTYRLRVR